jgi:hypothetical protein
MATTQSSSPSHSPEITKETPLFSAAGATWFAEHQEQIKRRTKYAYSNALRSLDKFFGQKPIDEIALVHLRMYQQLRSTEVSAHAVNRELGVLQQVLRKFGFWAHLQGHYRQLEEAPSRPSHGPSESKSERTDNLISFPVRGGVA